MKSTKWLNQTIKLIGLLPFGITVASGQTIPLEKYYDALQENYPLMRNTALLTEEVRLNDQKLKKNFLPQAYLGVQATYQNEVTALTVNNPSGMTVNLLSKDQYKASVSLQQSLYDGGAIGTQRDLNRINGAVSQQQNEVSIYQVREQVIKLYFQALLSLEQKKINEAAFTELQARIKAKEGALKFGAALLADVNALKAELLRLQQDLKGLDYDYKTFIESLNVLTGLKPQASVELSAPNAGQPLAAFTDNQRPEYTLFEKQRMVADAQLKVTFSGLRPKLSLFGDENYGRPGYNFLRNDFGQSWLVGAKISWNLNGFYTRSHDKKIAALSKEEVNVRQDIFRIQQEQQLIQQRNQVDKIKELILSDEQIVKLRASVRFAAAARLDNGTATVADFLAELQSEKEAALTKALHQLQLSQAYEQMKFIQGLK